MSIWIVWNPGNSKQHKTPHPIGWGVIFAEQGGFVCIFISEEMKIKESCGDARNA